MLKKIAKKIVKKYTGPPPHEQIFFLWGTKGKKLPLGHQMEKTSFFQPLEELFSSLGRAGFLSFYFLGYFLQRVKKLLNFWNFVNIKVAKFKLNHLGFYCKPSLF